MEVSDQTQALATLALGREAWCPLIRRVGGSNSQCGHFEKVKNLFLLPQSEMKVFQPIVQ
jgi:hypothetical protein